MSNIIRVDSEQKRVIVQNSGNVTVRSDEPKQVIVQSAGLQGQSAYDVAVANGFVGTEIEWLTSLVGTTAANVAISLIASGAIGGHRVLVTNGDGSCSYADATNSAHVNRVIGISSSAAIDGADVTIITLGQIVESSWNWTIGQPVFIGTNGLLTQTEPTAPSFWHIIGVAIAADTIFVQQNQPIILA